MPKRNSQELLDRIQELAELGWTTREIGYEVGKSAKAVQKIYVRHGIHGLPSGYCPKEQNYFWNGGTTIDKDGYRLMLLREHPFANSGGYVREHRLVMEAHLKRYLLPTEVVHHKDKNKLNNTLENLELFQNNAQHLHVELSGHCPKWSPEGWERIQEGVRKRKLDYGSPSNPLR